VAGCLEEPVRPPEASAVVVGLVELVGSELRQGEHQ